MDAIGVRELRNHTSRVLQDVATRRKPVDITRHGRVIARIVPVEEPAIREDVEQFETVWKEMDELAEEIGARWPKGVSAVEAVSMERR